MPANQGEQAPSRGVKEQDTTVFTRGLKSMPGQELRARKKFIDELTPWELGVLYSGQCKN